MQFIAVNFVYLVTYVHFKLLNAIIMLAKNTHLFILLGLFLLNTHLSFGQITLYTVTDPQLTSLNPSNIISNPSGETILMKDKNIYTYINEVTDVFNCSICGDILDIAYIGDTMFIANGTKGIVRHIGDSTLQVTPLRATRLVADAEGNIYGIHHLDGLVVRSGSSWVQLKMSNSSIPTDGIYDLAMDNSGVLWMATHIGLISYNGTNFSVKTVPGNLSATLFEIEIDSSGNKWVVSAFGGIGKYTGTQWTTFPETFDPFQSLQGLAVLNNDEIWTTEGFGLYRYSSGSFQFIPFEDLGESEWEINQVLYGDKQNRLWIQNAFTPLKYLTTSPTSLTDLNENEINLQVYPNPASDEITIHVGEQFYGERQVRIINSNGFLIYKGTFDILNQRIIDVHNWVPGMYSIIISGEGQLRQKTFLVLKDY